MTMPTPSIDESTLPKLRLGLCQIQTHAWELEQNTHHALEALESAGEMNVNLAITPEAVFQGYPHPESEKEVEMLHEIAEPLEGSRIREVQSIASRYEMDIVLGFIESAPNGNLHNSCAYINRHGEILLVYRKVHCRPFEDARISGLYTPGDHFYAVPCSVEDTTYPIGLAICFDREIPESIRCLRSLGSELIACPIATNTSRLDQPSNRVDNEMLTRARAAENEVFIAVVNHAGLYNGGSFVVGPTGEVLHQCGTQPEVVSVDIPLGAVREFFHSNPQGWAAWDFRRPGVYKSYLE